MAQISDLKARSIKPDDKPIAHGGVTGLLLYPSSTKGRGKWLLRYASPISKKRRMMGLGAYPEVGISQAGKLAIIAREKIAAGIDPLDEKEEVRETKTIPLFRDAAQTLHNELKPSWKNKKHAAQWITTIEEYANPHIGNMRLDKILPKHIADVLRPIWLTKSETASRLKQRIHAVMAWGWAQEYCQSNPVDVVMKLLPVQESKTPYLSH